MIKEAIQGLNIRPGEWYIDGTYGGGGHTHKILELGGKVLAIDADATVFDYKNQNSSNLTTVVANFNQLKAVATDHRISQVSGILFDLGTSAMQLSPGRGFSFIHDEPLDMRMSHDLTVSAKDLVNGLSKKELTHLFTKYAQESRAHKIAQAIVQARKNQQIQTTGELADICQQVYGHRHGKLHPATKVFQALRIAVNDELNSLQDTLPQTKSLLKSKGRLVVISFHEGEDRIVKHFINESEEDLVNLTPQPMIPTPKEIDINPRSRSAKLRIAEKK